MLTLIQIQAIVMLLQAFGVSSSTIATVQSDMQAQIAISTPDVIVSQTQVVTPPVSVNFGGEATTTSQAVDVPQVPVCDDTPIVMYAPWITGTSTYQGSQNPVVLPLGDDLVFSVTVSSCEQENWKVSITYPYYNSFTGGTNPVIVITKPSTDLSYGSRLNGGLYSNPAGDYTSYIVVNDGNTVATTTVPITVR